MEINLICLKLNVTAPEGELMDSNITISSINNKMHELQLEKEQLIQQKIEEKIGEYEQIVSSNSDNIKEMLHLFTRDIINLIE